jgi:NAD(P)-dependent dehydrogenase (short-subunit alcohol dehydrogenase family)
MAAELAGQVAIVTGGGRGIGRALALSLAAAGAAVCVAARSRDQINETAAMINAQGGMELAVVGDVTDRSSVEQMVADAERRFGPVDLLVNNAGIAGPVGPLWEVDPHDWWRCVEVNLEGPFLCCAAVLPGMVARRRGRIINIVSRIGARPFPYLTAYNAAKTALIRLTETLAEETREHGIAVLGLDPGFVRTDIPQWIGGSPGGRRWLPDFAAHAEADAQPPDAAARLCVSLASGRADALSGRYISVRDDLEEILRRAPDLRASAALTLRLQT